MSRVDQLTGKKPLRGNTRSFSMNHSPRRWELNLQKATIKDGNGYKTLNVTAKTLKTLRKQKKLLTYQEILAMKSKRPEVKAKSTSPAKKATNKKVNDNAEAEVKVENTSESKE